MTAGLSAGGAEAVAPVLSNFLYGKDAKDLTADEKSTISAITGLVASGVGATTGDVSSTVQGGQVAQNAVENNYLTAKQIQQFDQEMANCKVNNNCGQVLKKYEDIALNQDKELAAICSVNAVLCKEKYGFIINSRKAIKEALDKNKNIPAFYESALFSQQMAAEGFIFNVELARDFKNKYNISDEDAVRYAAIVSSIGVGRAIKGQNKSPVRTQNDAYYKFPTNPNDLTNALGVQPKVSTTQHGTTRMLWEPNSNTRIRYESHPNDPGTYNARHHGEHYHIEVKPDNVTWNQAKKQGYNSKG